MYDVIQNGSKGRRSGSMVLCHKFAIILNEFCCPIKIHHHRLPEIQKAKSKQNHNLMNIVDDMQRFMGGMMIN